MQDKPSLDIAPGAVASLISLHLGHHHFDDAPCLAAPTLQSLEITFGSRQRDAFGSLGSLPSLTRLSINADHATGLQIFKATLRTPRLSEFCPHLKARQLHQCSPPQLHVSEPESCCDDHLELPE